jgi:hypothetical protein
MLSPCSSTVVIILSSKYFCFHFAAFPLRCHKILLGITNIGGAFGPTPLYHKLRMCCGVNTPFSSSSEEEEEEEVTNC